MREYYYMITIRAHQVKRHIPEKELIKILTFILNDDLHYYDHDVELDPKYKQLHLHAILWSSKKLIYKDRPTSKWGFRIYYKQIGSLPGAVSYLHKNEFQCHKQINECPSPEGYRRGQNVPSPTRCEAHAP